MPGGCSFHPRCFRARQVARQPGTAAEALSGESLPTACIHEVPAFASPHGEHLVACHFAQFRDTEYDGAATRSPPQQKQFA